MSYDEPMDWVVIPPTGIEAPFNYGVRQTNDFQLFIASACCAAILVKKDRTGSEAACKKCGNTYYMSPYDGFKGEEEPFMLSWGQFPWQKVERVMTEWLDFYFNLTKDGTKDIEFRFDGMTAEEQRSKTTDDHARDVR